MDCMMKSSSINTSTWGHYIFDALPQAILRDLILREMLDLEDIARLEVAAAVHRLHDEDKVRYSAMILSCYEV
jgi:hypothetical protein